MHTQLIEVVAIMVSKRLKPKNTFFGHSGNSRGHRESVCLDASQMVRRTSVSVCRGVSASVELSLVDVMAEATDVSTSSLMLADGGSAATCFTSSEGDKAGGPSELCS